MAQQYSPASPYGSQPPASYYTPFTPTSGQQMSNGTPNFQYPNAQHPSLHSPTGLTNSARYDANAQVQAQPAPLPFAPHLNPELFKHFPPPPPLPMPNSVQFGGIPGGITGFAHFPPTVGTPPHHPAQQHYPPLAQSGPHLGAAGQPAPSLGSTELSRPYNQNSSASGIVNPADPQYQQVSPAYPPVDASVHGAPFGRPFSSVSGNFDSANRNATTATTQFEHPKPNTKNIANSNEASKVVVTHAPSDQAANGPHAEQLSVVPSLSSQLELKESAKAAVLSLLPHSIRYNDLVAEGINPRVLQDLYEELGLASEPHEVASTGPAPVPSANGKQKEQNSSKERSRSAKLQVPNTDATIGPATSKISPVTIAPSAATQTASPSMERKDRIAQLLAAKAGKPTTSGIASTSQSPTSATEAIRLQLPEAKHSDAHSPAHSSKLPRNLAHAEIVRQKMERLKKETMAKAEAEQLQTPPLVSTLSGQQSDSVTTSTIQQPLALPTPIREHLVPHGLSSLIPGLFMTSAEPDDNPNDSLVIQQQLHMDQELVSPAQSIVEDQYKTDSLYDIQSSRSSRKRSSADASLDSREDQQSENEMPQTAEEHDTLMEDRNREVFDDDASDGEIVEDDFGTRDLPSNTTEKPTSTSYRPEPTNQDYLSKQTQIDIMRKKIAEMEQRQTLKRGQSYGQSPSTSAASTPTALTAAQTIMSSPPSKVSDPRPQGSRLDERIAQSPRSLVKATPEQIAERAARLKADFLRQRALRQKQLQEGIPALNNEVTKTQNKLKEIKARLAQVQADLQQHEVIILRVREDEKQLLQEIESLEKQISDGVTGQKQFKTELDHIKQQTTIPTTTNPLTQRAIEESKLQHSQDAEHDPAERSPPMAGEVAQSDMQQSNESEDINASPSATPYTAISNTSPPVPVMADTSNASTGSDVLATTDSDVNQIAHEIAVEPITMNTEVYQAKQLEPQAEDSDEAMDESDEESNDSHMSIDDETDDSVSMSNSGSEEYEPAEATLSHDSDEKMDSDDYEPEVEDEQKYDETSEEEGEEYEPAENSGPAAISQRPSISTTAHSNPVVNLTGDTHDLTVTPDDAVLGAVQSTTHQDQNTIDDHEHGLQLSEADTLTKPQNLQINNEADGSYVLGSLEPSAVRYVPYQSPLSSFKSYRFHPFFSEQIKDGYRSLTYSHKIDSKLPICPSELNGIACTDPQCQEQHFGSMALTDDKILVQMSSANDIKEKSLRDQYLLGLKQVIARLRQEGVKEFSAVADALSHYRREWTAAQTSS